MRWGGWRGGKGSQKRRRVVRIRTAQNGETKRHRGQQKTTPPPPFSSTRRTSPSTSLFPQKPRPNECYSKATAIKTNPKTRSRRPYLCRRRLQPAKKPYRATMFYTPKSVSLKKQTGREHFSSTRTRYILFRFPFFVRQQNRFLFPKFTHELSSPAHQTEKKALSSQKPKKIARAKQKWVKKGAKKLPFSRTQKCTSRFAH